VLTDSQKKSSAKTLFKKPLLYSSLLVGIALLVVLWILYSRWEQNRLIDRRTRDETTRKQLENDRITLEQLGGKELAIQSFYASPGAIHRGASVQLCYGVANAKVVKLDPQPNAVWPSYARCVKVSPGKNHYLHLNGHRRGGEYKVTVAGSECQVNRTGEPDQSCHLWFQFIRAAFLKEDNGAVPVRPCHHILSLS
jgi:hypothetical protein